MATNKRTEPSILEPRSHSQAREDSLYVAAWNRANPGDHMHRGLSEEQR